VGGPTWAGVEREESGGRRLCGGAKTVSEQGRGGEEGMGAGSLEKSPNDAWGKDHGGRGLRSEGDRRRNRQTAVSRQRTTTGSRGVGSALPERPLNKEGGGIVGGAGKAGKKPHRSRRGTR